MDIKKLLQKLIDVMESNAKLGFNDSGFISIKLSAKELSVLKKHFKSLN